MNNRYMVISPDTLEAMRRAGHAAKLEVRIEKLEAGINALVNCQSALPRAALREAAADILDKRTWRTEDQSPLVSQNHAFRFRIEKLEAALREIAALGFWDGDSAMNIARKALEGKDE